MRLLVVLLLLVAGFRGADGAGRLTWGAERWTDGVERRTVGAELRAGAVDRWTLGLDVGRRTDGVDRVVARLGCDVVRVGLEMRARSVVLVLVRGVIRRSTWVGVALRRTRLGRATARCWGSVLLVSVAWLAGVVRLVASGLDSGDCCVGLSSRADGASG